MISQYYNIYYFTVCIAFVISIFLISELTIRGRQYPKINDYLFRIGIVFYLFYFGFRNVEIGTDTAQYVDDFIRVKTINSPSDILTVSRMHRDPFFAYFTFLCSRIMSIKMYLFTISAVYLGAFYLLIKRLSNRQSFFYFVGFLSFFFFIQLGVNIIRNGMSIMLIMLGIDYLKNRKLFEIKKDNFKGWGLIFLGIQCHQSGIVIILVYLFVRYFWILQVKYFVIAFFIGIFLAYLKFSLADLPYIGAYISQEERLTSYLEGAVQPPSGVNPYIIVFQVLILIYPFFFRSNLWKEKDFVMLMKMYLFLSTFYAFCLNMYFSDRFGIFSWVFIPLILAYPLTTGRNICKRVLLYLVFTLSYFLLALYKFYSTQG